MKGKIFGALAVFSIVSLVALADENPMFTNGQVTYYKNMKTCTPATFSYDALMMGYKNTNKILGKQDGKCVIREEIRLWFVNYQCTWHQDTLRIS